MLGCRRSSICSQVAPDLADHTPLLLAELLPSQVFYIDRTDTKMSGMQSKMMADMKSLDAKVDTLVTKMNAATGNARVDAIAEWLTRWFSSTRPCGTA